MIAPPITPILRYFTKSLQLLYKKIRSLHLHQEKL